MNDLREIRRSCRTWIRTRTNYPESDVTAAPVAPETEGLDDVPYMTSDLLTSEEDMELKELLGSLVMVGGVKSPWSSGRC